MAQGKLGFGFMRLPVIDGVQENIDLEQLKRMVDEFLGNGFTYFDTSYAYHNGKSEEALRKSVVERYPRSQFTIATKLPTFVIQTEDQVEEIFAQQLKNLGTDYVDYYLLHILNTKFYNGLDGKGGVVKNCHLFEHAPLSCTGNVTGSMGAAVCRQHGKCDRSPFRYVHTGAGAGQCK